jgi:Ca2+-binding RTX toxin-like protein
VTVDARVIDPSFFGMSVMAAGYEGYATTANGVELRPPEPWPQIPFSIERSLAVWSPGDGTVHPLNWAQLNPAPGVFDFSGLDAWMNECKAHGTEMVFTLESANVPAWAGGSNPDPAAFQAFVTAIVTHAAGQIKYWEGLNEFDSNFTGSITDLVTLQKELYQTVKQIDPSATVISPCSENSYNPQAIVDFLNAGGGSWFDVLAVHEYIDSSSGGVELMAPWIDRFKAALANSGLSDKPIWTTEWGWTPSLTDPNAQAAYASKALVLQAALGVQRELFYAYDADSFGVYNYATGQVSAAGVALQETEQWLVGATMPNGYKVNGTIYSAQLTRGGENSLVVWDSAGSSSYSAGPYTEYVDLQGKVHAVTNGAVTIGSTPILLETPMVNAPAITGFTPDSGIVGDGITSAKTVTLTGTADASSVVQVFEGSTQIGSATVDANGNWKVTSKPLAEGVHSMTATASDAAGHTGVASAALSVTIDSTAPAAPSPPDLTAASDNGSSNTDNVTSVTTPIFTGTAEAGSTVSLYDGTTQIGSATADGSGNWNVTSVALHQGVHGITATATDRAGNIGPASTALSVTIDTTAPADPYSPTAIPRPQPYSLPASAAYVDKITATTLTPRHPHYTATGGSSNDDLSDGHHVATMAGGGGDDTYETTVSKDAIVENAGGGVDNVRSSVTSYTLPDNVENLTLIGTNGQTGIGNALNNIITSTTGNDTLVGGLGNDILAAGTGADRLTGGSGNDIFVFPKVGVGSTITDFHIGADLIDLRPMMAASAYHGTDPVADHMIALTSDGNGGSIISVDPTHSGTMHTLVDVPGVTPSMLYVGVDVLWH